MLHSGFVYFMNIFWLISKVEHSDRQHDIPITCSFYVVEADIIVIGISSSVCWEIAHTHQTASPNLDIHAHTCTPTHVCVHTHTDTHGALLQSRETRLLAKSVLVYEPQLLCFNCLKHRFKVGTKNAFPFKEYCTVHLEWIFKPSHTNWPHCIFIS
jgi:hypothetical protein